MRRHHLHSGHAIVAFIITLLVGIAAGFLISQYIVSPGEGKPEMAAAQESAEKEILYWVAPMDASYRRDGPGKSPMGMDLVPVYTEEEEEKKEPEILYWVAPMDASYRRDGPGKSPMGMDLVPVYAEETSTDDSVHINAAVRQSLGVRTSEVKRRSLWRKVETTGYVGFDETRVSQINLRTEGWIEKLMVKSEGVRIKKGSLLFEFYSPQLVNAQNEFIQAKRRDSRQMTEAARRKLVALGMVETDIAELSKTMTVKNTVQVQAPQDGIVTNLNVREGMFVKPATDIMSLADLSSVWLQAEVFESQTDWVLQNQSAEARLNYMPGEVFSGRVDYVYPVLDPKTRTLQVRLRFDNPDERMKPNMYAQVTIFGKSHPGALSIPREALIRGQDTDRVVVSLGDGYFAVQEVMTGIESGGWVEIIAGLSTGDEVVTSSQFLIDSEASLAGSIRRLEQDHHAGHGSRPSAVFASGVVKAVDAGARRIRVSHGPIESLGWAPMTMEFDVLADVNLQDVSVGQNIHFSITESEVGDYVVDVIHQAEPAGVDVREEEEPMQMHHHHQHQEGSS